LFLPHSADKDMNRKLLTNLRSCNAGFKPLVVKALETVNDIQTHKSVPTEIVMYVVHTDVGVVDDSVAFGPQFDKWYS
jgi:hypothetical protein